MKLILSSILILFSWACFAQETERMLGDALKDYGTLQADIDRMLKMKMPECGSKIGNEKNRLCSIKAVCDRPELIKDGPVLYKNAEGESLYSDSYFSMRDSLNTCLMDKFSDELAAQKDELLQKLGNEHLRKILSANKKLSALVKKFNQGSALQKISSEILNMTLQANINNEEPGWDKRGTSRDDLMALIAEAQGKAKVKLNSEIKKTLVEIQYLKNNPDFLNEVEKLNRVLVKDTQPENPFFDWSRLIDEQSAGGAKAMKKNHELLEKKSQEAYVLFQETSKDVLTYLESKKTKANSAMMDRMIERVKTIRFEPPRLTPTLKKHCAYPNAFYSSRTHSLTICPQMLGYPKMALIETLAHEISHSIDSCNFAGKFYKKRGPSIAEEAPFEINIKMDPVSGNFQTTFYDDIASGTRLQDKAKYADNPFSKTLSCLKNTRSVGAVALDEKEILKKADKALAELKRQGQDVPNNPEAKYLHALKENGKDYFDYFQGCDLSHNGGDTLLRSQMQEAFADKMASEIVAAKIGKRPRAEVEKAVLEIALSYGNICSNESSTDQMIRDFAAREGCRNFYENKTLEEKVIMGVGIASPVFDSHSKANLRIEHNLLAHPQLRKALSCSYDRGVKYCE